MTLVMDIPGEFLRKFQFNIPYTLGTYTVPNTLCIFFHKRNRFTKITYNNATTFSE